MVGLSRGNYMTDIVLIHPSADVYQELSGDLTAVEPPPWTRMIAGWLRDHHHDVIIIDQEAERLTHKPVAEFVQESGNGLVAIIVEGHQPSASTQQMSNVKGLVEQLRKHGNKKIILVGNHVSALPERTLREEDVDYVCDGEGPLTLDGLIKELPLYEIPGLVWRSDHSIEKNTRAPLIPIDDLHGDVWDLLPMDKYRAHTWQCLNGSSRQPYASIYTTLGCPFKCSFCMINVFQHANTYRRRTPSKVVEQIEKLYKEYGVKTFKFADEMFVLDPSHYLPVCEGLAALPFAKELNIWAYARIDTVKPETLALMRRAGIRWLALGIESGSSYVRDGSMKSLDDNDIRKTVKAIQDADISVIGNFIYGLPDDTQESMRETLNLAKSLELDFANLYVAQAYPGSRLHAESPHEILPTSWLGYSQHSYETQPLPTATLSSVDVLRFRDNAFKEYFTDERYLDFIDKKFGKMMLSHIKNMVSVDLPRRLLEVTA
jgi:radical SAM superfamily enzyme YgiQ (UPF0313 family)